MFMGMTALIVFTGLFAVMALFWWFRVEKPSRLRKMENAAWCMPPDRFAARTDLSKRMGRD